MLTPEELKRYKRHIDLPEFGEEKQLALKNSKVLVIGAGGLGSPVLLYLAAAGVGTIGIVENDIVDISNLQRQILYTTNDIGKEKAEIAANRLKNINPDLKIDLYNKRLNTKNAEEIIKDYQIVVDCPDNYATRLIVSDITKKIGIPHVYASVSNYQGQVSVFNYKGASTYSDLFTDIHSGEPDNTVTDQEKALLGVLPGIVGAIQACEAIKIITNTGEVMAGKMMLINILDMSTYTVNI